MEDHKPEGDRAWEFCGGYRPACQPVSLPHTNNSLHRVIEIGPQVKCLSNHTRMLFPPFIYNYTYVPCTQSCTVEIFLHDTCHVGLHQIHVYMRVYVAAQLLHNMTLQFMASTVRPSLPATGVVVVGHTTSVLRSRSVPINEHQLKPNA